MQTVITWYRDLTRWDIKNYLYLLRSAYPVENLGKYIYEHSEKENISRDKEKDFPILGVTNKDGVYLNEYVKGKNINQSYKKVKKGELTYNPYRVNVGSIGIVQDEYDGFYISPAYVVFGTREGLINEYIYIVLSAGWFNTYLRAATSGSVRQNLTFELLSELKVPIPPLKIQQNIVEQWHNAQKKADELKTQIQGTESTIDGYMSKELGILKKANLRKKGPFIIRFVDLIRWDVPYNAKDLLTERKAKYTWRSIKEFCVSAQYGFTGSATNQNTRVKFLRITDLDYSGKYNEAFLPYVNIGIRKKDKYLLQENDFVVARTGATAGKCGIVRKTPQETVFASYLIRLKLRGEINLRFLEQYLNQGPGKRIVSDVVYSSGRPNINANEIQEIKIPLPPLPKQRQIVDKVDSIRAEISRMRTKSESILENARQEIGKTLLKR